MTMEGGKLELLCRQELSMIMLLVNFAFFMYMKTKICSPLYQPGLFCLQVWQAS